MTKTIQRLLIVIGILICLIIAVDFAACSESSNSKPESILTSEGPKTITVSRLDVIEKPTQETPKPEKQEYISLGEFKLYAYCPCVKCCGVWSSEHSSRIGTDYIQKTASGTIPQANRTISVDPSIIPLGSMVVINNRTYIAEDTGNAIQGNCIDIYFNTHQEALEFGVQNTEIFILNNK